MQCSLALKVFLNASEACADLIVSVHMRNLVHVILFDSLEQVGTYECRIHALDGDVLVKQMTVIPIAVGRVERIAGHAVLCRTMVLAVMDIGVDIFRAENAYAHHAVVGIVFGEVVSGVNVIKDMAAGLRNFFGGRSETYEGELIEARENAVAEMQSRAAALGANAVVGVDIDYEVLGADNGMLMVTASGTAVVCE